MSAENPIRVLFVCTGNSARSIMAEALLRHWGKGRFEAYSAGAHPRGEVHPLTLETLRRHKLPTEGLRNKSWDEFAGEDAAALDLVVTVCDEAAGETCPVLPGAPVQVHWGIPDPAAAQGDVEVQLKAFREAYSALDTRVKLLTALRDDHFVHLRDTSLRDELERIHRDAAPSA
ncbi:arsenate reductase ArsC [Solimonas sp. K1W22B-7]|uniref:arsenate reductase ArsC n=1 Tax=Solimonas sp. K1W22B-7 TaxID=2303331 RepID=UPI000E32FB3F|nr:arsenate reductase ArsC [Solimonas sp. K1W22B-7]AXQ27432.1 arsenate reductase ArsC [Solimonas sp. K1W22B-7]